MSVLDFPTSPTNGQYYGGYVWNAANETWDSAYAPRAATIPISSPNYIINGAFEINQRAFTSTTTSNAFGHDRWSLEMATGTNTYSTQAFTPGTSLGTDEPENFARIVTTGQSGTTALAIFKQKIENVRLLAGQTATISFWAKAVSGTPKVAIEINQNFGSGGSPSALVNTYAGQVTLSTSWASYSVTVNVPTTFGKTLGTTANTSFTQLSLWVSAGTSFDARTGSLGIQNNTFDFWGVQVEEGAAPTEFRRNANSLQGELAACQRYYYQMGPQVTGSGQLYVGFGLLQAPLTTVIVGRIQFPVKMRTTPSSVLWTGITSNYAIYTGSGAISGSPSIGGDRSSEDSIWLSWPGSGFTSLGAYYLTANNTTSAYLGFSAEL
jgi:hypothetical protein